MQLEFVSAALSVAALKITKECCSNRHHATQHSTLPLGKFHICNHVELNHVRRSKDAHHCWTRDAHLLHCIRAKIRQHWQLHGDICLIGGAYQPIRRAALTAARSACRCETLCRIFVYRANINEIRTAPTATNSSRSAAVNTSVAFVFGNDVMSAARE